MPRNVATSEALCTSPDVRCQRLIRSGLVVKKRAASWIEKSGKYQAYTYIVVKGAATLYAVLRLGLEFGAEIELRHRGTIEN